MLDQNMTKIISKKGKVYSGLLFPVMQEISLLNTAILHAVDRDFIMTLEKGYDIEVSDENNIFSVGQKQLVMLIR